MMRFDTTLDLIVGGRNDKGIFKAIFLSGSPGSGKSFFVNKALTGLGFKVINPDIWFEKEMKKRNLSLKDLKHPEAEKLQIKGTDEILPKMQKQYDSGRLPVIIDRTGTNPGPILDYKKKLEDMGYETQMYYIKTEPEVAYERNNTRERKVPDDYINHASKAVPKNQKMFKEAFGSNYFVINNTPPFDEKKKKEFDKIFAKTQKWFNTPVNNDKSKKWKKEELEAHKKRVNNSK